MLIYWTYVAAVGAATVAMFLAVQAWQLHLACFAMSFAP
jgi:hypothetical protein